MSSKNTAKRKSEAPSRRALLAPVPTLPGDSEDAKFSRLVYERVRLGIMSALAVNEQLTFADLKSLFEVSDGNLSAHARKLEDAGFVTCNKSFEGRRPKTEYRLTPAGRKALHRYLEHMEAVIKATRRG
jgi:DNA-binding MarR family transcriptional regulator